MPYLGKMTAAGNTAMPISHTLYGTCSTAAATVAKVVTCAAYDTLEPDAIICVYMQYSNTAASPTLNVNSKGAKPIYRYGTTVPGTNAATSWEAGTMVLFKYDTTLNTSGCYVMVGYRTDTNTNTTYSAGTGLSLSSTTFSLGTSGVTAGSYGPSANASPAHSGTFSVPYITVDTYGRVTAASTKTITLPADNNTTYTAGTGLSLSSNKFSISKVPIANGGTNATTAADARTNLGVAPIEQGIEYIVGTQTAATNLWTGATTSTSLYTGKTIAYKLPYAGTSTAATLELTLAGGSTTTGAKAVYINNSAVTKHYAAGTVIRMTYDGTYWRTDNYNADTKNTAGSTDSSSKLFLIGATSQAANPTTYSQDTAFVGTDGHLYSNSVQVVNLSGSQALTNKTYNGYTLAAACAKAVTDSSSASAISTGTSLTTERDVYYGLPTINNAHNYTSSTAIYAPTAGGTAGYELIGNGDTAAPIWKQPPYGNCTIAADTAAKTVAVTNFKLVNGVHVFVRFANANTAASPTLNVNSTGAKSMYYAGAVITGSNFTFKTNVVYEFVYASPDNTNYYWMLVGMSGAPTWGWMAGKTS